MFLLLLPAVSRGSRARTDDGSELLLPPSSVSADGRRFSSGQCVCVRTQARAAAVHPLERRAAEATPVSSSPPAASSAARAAGGSRLAGGGIDSRANGETRGGAPVLMARGEAGADARGLSVRPLAVAEVAEISIGGW